MKCSQNEIKKARIIHDNLNAGGGSERLAFATIELLNEMGFKIDLLTLQKPNSKVILEEVIQTHGILIRSGSLISGLLSV